jgi:hypothetical protein
MVKAEWFRRYRENERPERFDRIVQSWDTANKATELSDFSACTTWGVSGKHLFLLGVFRRRLEYPAPKRAVREQQSLFDATEVLIEDKASGTQLIQELIEDGCHGVTRYQPTIDKVMRLHAQTGLEAEPPAQLRQAGASRSADRLGVGRAREGCSCHPVNRCCQLETLLVCSCWKGRSARRHPPQVPTPIAAPSTAQSMFAMSGMDI